MRMARHTNRSPGRLWAVQSWRYPKFDSKAWSFFEQVSWERLPPGTCNVFYPFILYRQQIHLWNHAGSTAEWCSVAVTSFDLPEKFKQWSEAALRGGLELKELIVHQCWRNLFRSPQLRFPSLVSYSSERSHWYLLSLPPSFSRSLNCRAADIYGYYWPQREKFIFSNFTYRPTMWMYMQIISVKERKLTYL